MLSLFQCLKRTFSLSRYKNDPEFCKGKLAALNVFPVVPQEVPEAGNPATSLLKLTLSQLSLTPDSPYVG